MRRSIMAAAVFSMLLALPSLALDLDDVFRMLEADVDEEVILRVVDTEQARFVLTADDIIDLQYAGASDWFLKEMVDRSPEPARRVETRYVYDPYAAYYTIGVVYDPFDYYFVTWPYYYAYVSPFRFTWTWWYYGGPHHHHWCSSWSHRTHYYDHSWGCRTIWSRGYRDRVYQVPRYDASEKVMRRAVYARTGTPTRKIVRQDRTRQRIVSERATPDRRVYDRSGKVRRSPSQSPSSRTSRIQRTAPSEKPTRTSPAWGRSGTGSRGTTPARPSRSSVGSKKSRGSTSEPSKPSRPHRSTRSNSPSRPTKRSS